MVAHDPGHKYLLRTLDGDGRPESLWFVKREGPAYPGNVGSNPGTNIQEVCRALIDRLRYLDRQVPDKRNKAAQCDLQRVIWLLEDRAAERHGRVLQAGIDGIELLPACVKCGHVECREHAE